MTVQTVDAPHVTKWSLKMVLGGLATLIATGAAAAGIVEFYERRAVVDISGEWRLINTIEKTTYRPFNGLQLGYRIFLRQRGVEFEGDGEKWSENGVDIPSLQHTPIVLNGQLNGRQLRGTFREKGQRRETVGTFEWTLEGEGHTLTGTFTSTAAAASGTSRVERVSSTQGQ